MFTVKNLSVTLGKSTIIKKVNFSLQESEILVLSGPNGSGKTTLINALMGNPLYSLNSNSQILLNGVSIKKMPLEEKIKQGLFFTFQNPVSVPGVSLIKLWRELKIINPKNQQLLINELKSWAKKLAFSESLLIRGMNDGFSGGEKKKLEMVTAYYLAKKYVFFDEIDTGLDVQAQKTVAQMIGQLKANGLGCLVITHSESFIKQLSFDRRLVIKNGSLL